MRVGNDCRVYLYGSHEKVACDVVLSFDFAVGAEANYAVVDKHAQRVGRHGIAHIAQCGVAVGADAVEGVDRKVADVEFHVGVEREQSGNRERQLLWSKRDARARSSRPLILAFTDGSFIISVAEPDMSRLIPNPSISSLLRVSWLASGFFPLNAIFASAANLSILALWRVLVT